MNDFDFFYYKPKIKNFGDHLNEYIYKNLFFDSQLKSNVIGIGSILTKEFLTENEIEGKNCFVLGSGTRSIRDIPRFDIEKGSFFRGPLTNMVATLDTNNFISDGAYVLRQIDKYKKLEHTQKQYPISIIPYFRSLNGANWSKISKEFDLNFIDPTIPNGIDFFMEEVAKSKLIISEAMHGAIMADIFRIPWVRLEFLSSIFESLEVSTFKWKDWQYSIKLLHTHSIKADIYQSFVAQSKNFRLKNTWVKLNVRSNEIKLKIALENFLDNSNYYLSKPDIIHQIDSKIYDSLNYLR